MFELIESLAIHARGREGGRGRADPAAIPSCRSLSRPPVLPGSVQIELCAQVAGPLAEERVDAQHGVERWAFLGMVRNAAVRAPVALAGDARVASSCARRPDERDSAVVRGHRHARDRRRRCRVELVMMLDPEPAWADAIARLPARVAALEARAQP